MLIQYHQTYLLFKIINNTIDDSIISDFNWGRTKAEEQLYPHNKFYKTKIYHNLADV